MQVEFFQVSCSPAAPILLVAVMEMILAQWSGLKSMRVENSNTLELQKKGRASRLLLMQAQGHRVSRNLAAAPIAFAAMEMICWTQWSGLKSVRVVKKSNELKTLVDEIARSIGATVNTVRIVIAWIFREYIHMVMD